MAYWPVICGISNRMFTLDPNTASEYVGNLIYTCNGCGRFFFACTESPTGFSHGRPLVFADGACLNNGKPGARAGFGVAVGLDPKDRFVFPFGGRSMRTNQKAEIAALEEGVMRGVEALNQEPVAACSNGPVNRVVIASDSAYAVRGVTEWMPKWRANGFKTSRGTYIQNAAEFKRLDETICCYENLGYLIGFWHIPRQFNRDADALARQAASLDQGPPAAAPPRRDPGFSSGLFPLNGYAGHR